MEYHTLVKLPIHGTGERGGKPRCITMKTSWRKLGPQNWSSAWTGPSWCSYNWCEHLKISPTEQNILILTADMVLANAHRSGVIMCRLFSDMSLIIVLSNLSQHPSHSSESTALLQECCSSSATRIAPKEITWSVASSLGNNPCFCAPQWTLVSVTICGR